MQALNIYVAHPYDGQEENKKKVEEFIKLLIKKNIFHKPNFISPIHNYGYLYNNMEYEKGIDLCLNLLNECDIILIPKFEKIKMSKGCLIELGYAKHKGMEIIHWEDVVSINESN